MGKAREGGRVRWGRQAFSIRKLQLVSTKLRPPLLRPSMVERPRLLRGLDAAARGKLSLVCAAAGFGKTTLLLQWRLRLRRGGIAVGCLNIDGDDNDVVRFLSYLAGALSGADRALGEKALALLLLESGAAQVDAALTRRSSTIADLGRRVVLILDDYHLDQPARCIRRSRPSSPMPRRISILRWPAAATHRWPQPVFASRA